MAISGCRAVVYKDVATANSVVIFVFYQHILCDNKFWLSS